MKFMEDLETQIWAVLCVLEVSELPGTAHMSDLRPRAWKHVFPGRSLDIYSQ